MQGALTAMGRYVSSDVAIPLFLFEVHWEYDIGMDDGAAQTAYRAGRWDLITRLRAARPKNAGLHIDMRGHCPYQGGSWAAFDHVHAAWRDDFADASRYAFPACGNMLDAEPNTQYIASGDMSHWGNQAAPRIYPRAGFRFVKYAYDRGWLPTSVDLSDCPSMGPAITGVTRSGNSLIATVTHDKGGSLVAGQDGIDWSDFT